MFQPKVFEPKVIPQRPSLQNAGPDVALARKIRRLPISERNAQLDMATRAAREIRIGGYIGTIIRWAVLSVYLPIKWAVLTFLYLFVNIQTLLTILLLLYGTGMIGFFMYLYYLTR